MDYTELFTQLAVILITLMFGLITRKVLPWLDLKMSNETRDLLFKLAKAAVKAAEQIFSEPKSGEEKKQYVFERVLGSIPHVDVNELLAVIEALVYDMNLKKIAVPDEVEPYDYTAGSQD